MQRLLLLAGIWLLLGLRCAVAAEPFTNASPEETEPTAEASAESDTDEEAETETASTDTAADRSASGPADFVPTVQISEDLSVSFPADI